MMDWTWTSPLGISAVVVSLGFCFVCFGAGINLLARAGQRSTGAEVGELDRRAP